MILSIIVPAYNVEKYLEKCLLSCICQDISFVEYEIIVIDDGSQDKSGAIADAIASSYNNIHVIHQNNRGLSNARNEGVYYSKGEYIWFIDSDDWIEDNCLKRIVSQLVDIDILLLQYRKVYENGSPSVDVPFCMAEDRETGKAFVRRSLFPHPAQFAIYRKQFLIDNHLNFVEGIYHEDSEFKPRALYLANALRSDNMVCYNYLQRNSGSITSNYSIKRLMDLLQVIQNLFDFSKSFSYYEQQPINVQISINFNEILRGLRKLSREDQVVVFKAISKNRYFFNRMLKSGKLKYMTESILFRILPNITYRLFCLIN